MCVERSIEKNKQPKWKYILEILKLNHLQYYRNTFQLEYINFERKPQRNQFSTTFQFTIQEVFETLETANVDTKTANSSTMIERNTRSPTSKKVSPKLEMKNWMED